MNDLATSKHASSWSYLRVGLCAAMGICWLVQGLSYPHAISPDGLSYLETAAACTKGHWEALINGYWSPAYPFLLSFWLSLFKPTPYHEVVFAHCFNCLLLAGAFCCFEYFLNILLAHLRPATAAGNQESCPLPVWSLRAIGYTLFFWASLHATPPSTDTPDVLVLALVLVTAGIIVRIASGADGWLRFGALGVALGLAYLSKAVMFPLSFVFLGVTLFAARNLRRAAPRLLLASFMFLLVSGPFVLALSKSKERFTFGDSGGIAYAEFVNGVKLFANWQGGPPGSGTPKHPTRKVLESPPLYEFATPIAGSYPRETDLSYWYDGVRPHFELKRQLSALRHTSDTYFELSRRLGCLTAGFLVLLLLENGLHGFVRNFATKFFLWVPALAGFGVYSLILVDPRYVVGFAFLLWASLFFAVRTPPANLGGRIVWSVTLAVVILLGFQIAWSVGHSTARLISSRPFPEGQVVQELRRAGVQAGDNVTSVGDAIMDHYWAHLAGVSIVAEVPIEGVSTFWASGSEVKAHVFELFAKTGAKAVVAKEVPAPYLLGGWKRVANTDYCILVLQPGTPSATLEDGPPPSRVSRP